ncbi:MAG: membrane protein insertion efficiency factor YidD, partial [candidate division WOR-3 bacterium]
MAIATTALNLILIVVATSYDPMSVAGEWLIQGYKRVISPLQGKDICNFNPTCSQFTRTAIHNYGFAAGILMGADRLMRCNGFAWTYLGEHYSGVRNDRLVDPVEQHLAWQTPPLTEATKPQRPHRHTLPKTASVCDSSMLFATRLFETDAFREAALEYLRVRFSSHSPQIQTCASLMAGEAYLAGGEPANARRAFAMAKSSAAASFVTYGIARTFFVEARYSDTRRLLNSTIGTGNTLACREDLERQTRLLYAWSLYREGRFKDAAALAASIASDSNCLQLSRLDGSAIRRRSRLAATLFSAI